MSQNLSSAVMQQRSEPHDSLDDFPTPPWATRALCEWIEQQIGPLRELIVREPAANRGHMVRPLGEFFARVEAADIHDYGAGFPVQDYLFGVEPESVDFTITNPPFRLAEQFISRMRATSQTGCAVLVRTAFLESVGRFETLFRHAPPDDVLQFSERVVMHKGKLSATGSTATAYCWLVWWSQQYREPCFTPHLHWIPPCRKRLERPEDYLVTK
jgi:hypothetical protein